LGNVNLGLDAYADDSITMTQRMSGDKYYDDDTRKEIAKNDTQVLNLNLPSIGNMINTANDYLYGDGNKSGSAE
jgi:hypothetical protein